MKRKEAEEKVLTAIQRHRNDFGAGGDITLDSIMYCYGATDEFRDIIEELEEAFNVSLDNDIGEMTVQQFIDTVLEEAKD